MSEKSGAVFPSLTLCAKIGDTAAIAIADAIKKDFKYFMYEKITNVERKIKFKTPFRPGIYIISVFNSKNNSERDFKNYTISIKPLNINKLFFTYPKYIKH